MIEKILETLEKNEFEDYDSLRDWVILKFRELNQILSFKNLVNKISEAETDEVAQNILQEAVSTYCNLGYPKSLIERLKEIATLKTKSEIVDALGKLIEGLEGYGYPTYGYPYGYPMVAKETTNLVDIEIFRVGDYGEKGKYTIEDLENIVKNFYDLKDKIKVPLKLGHFSNLYFEPPAVGWVSDLRIDKEKGLLLADFAYVPKVIAELIKNKAYRNVSCELYMDEIEGKKPPVLRAVALLGATIPEVKGLDDLKVLYNNEEKRINIVGEIIQPEEAKSKPENEEIERLKQELLELKVEKFLEENEKKFLPKDRELVKTILVQLEKDNRVIKFGEEETRISELFKKFLINLPKLAYYEEFVKQDQEIDTELAEINQIMEKEKLSFSEAYEKYIKSKNLFNLNKEDKND